MKLRLVLIAAFATLIAFAGFSTQAIAASGGTASATKLEKNVKKAEKKAKSQCKKAKKVKKSKNASAKAKKKANKNCTKAKKNVKKLKKQLKVYNQQFFDVCKHGCKYTTVQKGADAAGIWHFKNKKRPATVRVQPGKYVEGVLMHGKQEGRNYNDLTIEGVKKDGVTPNPDARQVILDGTNAQTVVKGTPGWLPGDAPTIPANNAIEGRSITGLKLKNMWGRHYQNNTFFIWASHEAADQELCKDFVMDNLVSSDTRSYGLFSRNCFGGKFLNSEGWNHGDSALYIGETPCDDPAWTNRTTAANKVPCQAKPDWTIVKNFTSHQNVLGYSGTNSKYVNISDSSFFNNGAGIVPNTLDSEKFEPSGDLVLENNDIFWNNYNYYQGKNGGSEFETVENPNADTHYPIGIGVVLYGTDGVTVQNNNIFGNEKWGAANFSGPELFDINQGDDAKNLNNHFINNNMGRNGTDPNGNYDFFSDASGGGNCWSGNTASADFAPGNGSTPLSTIYPACPQATVGNLDVPSFNFSAGLQINAAYLPPADPSNDPSTIFGYATQHPPLNMECSMTLGTPHPAFTNAKGVKFTEKRANPVPPASCPVYP